ncbi:MAG: hypothetical protein L0Z70_00010, partial [Chloroflexi bacterium]|nr:hypothetical protein [Chloroflexota bacterium]
MIPLEVWLEAFDFDKNPFQITEAGGKGLSDEKFLYSTFVEPTCFLQVLGHPRDLYSSLVFAPRGGGKTTTMLLLAHFCREGRFNDDAPLASYADHRGRILPVIHRDFSQPREYLSNPDQMVNAHIEDILRLTIKELVEWTKKFPDLLTRVSRLDPRQRLEWQFLLKYFSGRLDALEITALSDAAGDDLNRSGIHPIGFPNRTSPPSGMDPGDFAIWYQNRSHNTYR